MRSSRTLSDPGDENPPGSQAPMSSTGAIGKEYSRNRFPRAPGICCGTPCSACWSATS